MISFEKAGLSYGEKPVLRNVTLRVQPGEHAALLGPSGCGKSSLLNLAAGLLRPTEGTVTVNARRAAYAFQEARLLPWRTAAENVNAVLDDSAATMLQALAWLEAVGLADAADKLPAELSGGMRQRVNLARALAYDGDLLLLDEPLKELDPSRLDSILSLLRTHAAGKTLLLAIHDIGQARALADSLYVFRDMTFVPQK